MNFATLQEELLVIKNEDVDEDEFGAKEEEDDEVTDKDMDDTEEEDGYGKVGKGIDLDEEAE